MQKQGPLKSAEKAPVPINLSLPTKWWSQQFLKLLHHLPPLHGSFPNWHAFTGIKLIMRLCDSHGIHLLVTFCRWMSAPGNSFTFSLSPTDRQRMQQPVSGWCYCVCHYWGAFMPNTSHLECLRSSPSSSTLKPMCISWCCAALTPSLFTATLPALAALALCMLAVVCVCWNYLVGSGTRPDLLLTPETVHPPTTLLAD